MHPLQKIEKSKSFDNFRNILNQCENDELGMEDKTDLIENFIVSNDNNFPIRSNNEVYFIFFGSAELIHVVGDFNGWDSFDETSKMNKISGTNLFYLYKQFENDSRLDYQFVVDTEWILDPLNPRTILGGFGHNSELVMPFYFDNISTSPSDIPKGTVKEFRINSLIQKNWTRRIYVYFPPNYDYEERKYPTFYAVDGTDYIQAGDAIQILDTFINEERIPPIIGIFIDPLSPALRIRDFNGRNCKDSKNSTNIKSQNSVCKEKYIESLVKELVPFIDNNFRTINNPALRAHLGVSLGGILSTYIGSQYPDLFNLVGSQSGAFWIDPTVYESFQRLKLQDRVKFYLSAGTYEKRNFSHTKNFAEVLTQNHYILKEEYFHQGHSWGLWKGTFGQMLEFLFSG